MNINGKIRLFCSIHLLSALFLGAGTVWHVVITPCGGISHSSRTHLPLRSQLRGDMMMNMIHISMELGIGATPGFSVFFKSIVRIHWFSNLLQHIVTNDSIAKQSLNGEQLQNTSIS